MYDWKTVQLFMNTSRPCLTSTRRGLRHTDRTHHCIRHYTDPLGIFCIFGKNLLNRISWHSGDYMCMRSLVHVASGGKGQLPSYRYARIRYVARGD
eukprot:7608347-Pyramimonas_sp.AAC.1